MKINKTRLLTFFECSIVVIYLILYSGGPLTVILADGFSEGEGDGTIPNFDFSLIQAAFLLNYVLSTALLLLHWKSIIRGLSHSKFILVLIFFTSCSALWSPQLSESLTKVISLIGTTLFGLYFGTRFKMEDQLKILGTAFIIIVLGSFLFAIGFPKYGIMGGTHAGDWRGIYWHKNVLGQMMTLSVLIFLCLSLVKSYNRFYSTAAIGLSLLLLALSTSTSALINCITLVAIFLYLQTFRFREKVMLPTLFGVSGIAHFLMMFLYINVESILNTLGKDLTLTGRADMWPIVVQVASERSLFGFGYGGFWGDFSSPGALVWKEYGWLAPNAHNGFLDLWVQIGFVGTTLFTICFLYNLLRGIYFLKKGLPFIYSWFLIFLSFTVVSNLTESALMINNSLNWILFVSISTSGISQESI